MMFKNNKFQFRKKSNTDHNYDVPLET